MSTCPDKDLYSAYFDGELLSPWKEKLEAHMAVCHECQAVFNLYKHLHDALEDKKIPEPDYTASFSKLLQKKRAAVLKAAVTEKERVNWFAKSVRIPIPVLAAAALLLFIFNPFLFNYIKSTDDGAGLHMVSNFKPIVPVSTMPKAAKKFNFQPGNIMSVPDFSSAVPPKMQSIDLNRFAGLYLPSQIERCEDVQSDDFEEEYPCFKINDTQFVPIFIYNGQ